MRNTASTSRRSFVPAPVDGPPVLGAGRWRVGRAYRGGRLVCGCVHVAIGFDDRLGMTRRERRTVRVRFCEPVADELRAELSELARRRGGAGERAAERIAPIEVVIDDAGGEHQRVTGRLRPAHTRHGRLREIEFGLRERA
jgi:hypothetical protein